MESEGRLQGEHQANESATRSAREVYADRFRALETRFAEDCRNPAAGREAVQARSAAVDALVRETWSEVSRGGEPGGLGAAGVAAGVALLAIGGYGRGELFPFSDVDLLILLDAGFPEKLASEPIRRLNQMLWDSGLRVSALTRTLGDCERFDPENVEFTLALLDARPLAGDAGLADRLLQRGVPKLVARERKRIVTRLGEVTRTRHARFGGTLFHLEPNVKECPGGLRDAHVCAWLAQLDASDGVQALLFGDGEGDDFAQARTFLLLLRTFLHLRHRRDDSVLDWQSQDAAAASGLGLGANPPAESPDAGLWMRLYYRHARAVARRVSQAMADVTPSRAAPRLPGLPGVRTMQMLAGGAGRSTGAGRAEPARFEVRHGEVVFRDAGGTAKGASTRHDPASDPEVALAVFEAMARTGARLSGRTEARLAEALPALAAQLEDGPALWRHLQTILTGPFAGPALRAMHAIGILELLIPEFHGIDALVIRDAYHRYTVDEHTFVVIDTLHGLANYQASTPPAAIDGPSLRLSRQLRDLPHPALLFLAALLHDVGKGHAATGHAPESARLAGNVLRRLQLDVYETGMVLDLIRNHLEMSAALRRDVFDQETIRMFAARVATPEALRMLTLFTYADIAAVHPGSLTPWKAENLWLLHIATANHLDRSVDDERISAAAAEDEPETTRQEVAEKMLRVRALLLGSSGGQAAGDETGHETGLERFLAGLPRRYLETRSPEQVKAHLEMAQRLGDGGSAIGGIELELRYAPQMSELTLVTRDRPGLFALMAGALAAWGMNIVTADAFSNGQAVVVDSFRFVDRFRTLELNETERDRFVANLREVVAGSLTSGGAAEAMLASRRRARRKQPKVVVATRIDFDHGASNQSTILEVIAQDTPGLLGTLAQTLGEHGCNIVVALVDTEGEMAIDVFYLTRAGAKLTQEEAERLRGALTEAIAANAG